MDSSSGSMSMDMGSTGSTCKLSSMLWNWETIDSCFLTEGWHNQTRGDFAGTCIGVVFLVVLIEFVRRCQREYDRSLLRAWSQRNHRLSSQTTIASTLDPRYSSLIKKAKTYVLSDPIFPVLRKDMNSSFYTPGIWEQAVRSSFYLLQFAGAYFTMLLAMYYNGYIIICIFIGAFLGNYMFGSDSFKPASVSVIHQELLAEDQSKTEATCCC